MKKFLLSTTAVLLVSTVFISCKKEKGEIPVQEEEATTINQGNGIMETVQKGPNGSTVVFSNWIIVPHTGFTGFGTSTITTEFTTSSLTDAVRDNGIVLVYYYDHNNNVVRLLPYIPADGFVFEYSFVTGKIIVKFRNLINNIFPDVDIDRKFRYVLIPSSTFSGPGGGRVNNSIDYSDYNLVCDYYGIQK